MIPKTVTRDEFIAAMKPLWDLLGTSAHSVYNDPAIVITGGGGSTPEGDIYQRISFCHVPVDPDTVAEGERPPGIRAATVTTSPQSDDWANELAVPITVLVIQPFPPEESKAEEPGGEQ